MINTLKTIWIIYLCLFLTCFEIRGQQFENLDFQNTCKDSKTGLCNWNLSWGGKLAVQPATVENQKCLLITGSIENSVGFTEQESVFESRNDLVIFTLSAFIKAESIEGKGAGLNIGLYDKNDALIANKDMGGFYSLDWIRGSINWKKCSIAIVCPPETVKIKIGAILYGKGKAYFKDIQTSLMPLENRGPSKLAKEYIGAACDSIRLHSLVRDSLDMTQLQHTALKIAGDAREYADCFLAINYLLESLRPFGDEHSFFMTAAEFENWESEGSQISKIEYPTLEIVDQCGYILVPPFHGGNQEQILSFADSLQRGIQSLYNSKIKGWVIDLRKNTGGNMGPMVAGLGPLFTTEKLGALIDINQKANCWYYKQGKYWWDDEPGWSVSNPVILDEVLPIAVLTGSQTGSSGEAVVVSFIGNEKTKLFGQPTWGLTTGNESFKLPDGSEIFLASTIYADKYSNRFDGPINPDFNIESNHIEKVDIILKKAIDWVLSQ